MYEEEKENAVSRDKFETATGFEMNVYTVMHPYIKGETLETIYINIDSKVLKSYNYDKL